MVLVAPFADACNKRVVPGRYNEAGKYLDRILLCPSKSSTELMLSVSNTTIFKASLSHHENESV